MKKCVICDSTVKILNLKGKCYCGRHFLRLAHIEPLQRYRIQKLCKSIYSRIMQLEAITQ